MGFNTTINGYSVGVTDHAVSRIVERFKALSISFPDEECYIDLGICGLEQVLANPFMDKYIHNLMMYNNHENVDVLVYDTLNKMVYAFSVKPFKNHIVLKTVGTERGSEGWL